MPASSLRDLEKTLTSLWMDSEYRNRVFSGVENTGLKSEGDTGLDKRGAGLYARLINIGHVDVMSSIYPYCSRVLGRQWETVVRDYIKLYPPQHYRLNKTASRFPEYVAGVPSLIKKFPFLSELADYEWVEMDLLEDRRKIERTSRIELAQPDDFVKSSPIMNPVHVLRSYTYPVAHIAELVDADQGFRKKFKPEESYSLIYRHPESHRCRFLELDEKTFKILETAASPGKTYADLLKVAVELTPHQDPHATVTEILELIERFHNEFVFVGSKAISE